MKLVASILALIFSLILVSCSSYEHLEIKEPNSLAVLEVSKELIGLWNVNDKMLELRLYENGLVEFDVLDNDKIVLGKINKTEDIKIKKQARISESEVKEILNLLKDNKFSNLESNYRAKRSCVDNFYANTIHFRYENTEKIIKVTGHCENLAEPNPENFPDFPLILSDLYKRIDKIKIQAAKKN